jgi:hypothetical protein
MLRDRPRQGRRFLAGFAAGLAVAAAVLSVPLLLLTSAAARVDETVRGLTLVALLVGLGVADLLNRTPHVWRQVPQRFARELPPGRLGLVWAIDLGLLVTTQKTTSLLWIGLAGLVLAGSPLPVVLAVVLVSTGFGLGVAALTLARSGSALTAPEFSRWVPWVRKASGTAALALAVVEIVRLPWA